MYNNPKINKLELFEYDHELCKGKKTNGSFQDYKKYIIKKPWGHEYLIYQSKEVSLWILNLDPKGSTSMHAHKLKDTYLIPINNKVRINLLEKLYYFSKKQIVLLPKKKFHQSKNINNTNLCLIEIELPNKKNDIIRHHDYYGRMENDFKKENNSNKQKKNNNYFNALNIEKKHYIDKKLALLNIKFKGDISNKYLKIFSKFEYFFILKGELTILDKNGKSKMIKKFIFYTSDLYMNYKFSTSKETDILFI